MTWVRYDDGAFTHRKVEALPDREFRIWVKAIAWSNKPEILADGRIRARELVQVHRLAKPAHAAKLVEEGLWHRAGHECPSPKCPPNANPDGWTIHDYFDHQPTRAKVLADRAVKAERQRNWMSARQATGGSSRRASGGARDAPVEVLLEHAPSPSPPRREAGIGDPRSANGAGPASPPATVRRKPPDRSPPVEEDPQVIAADQARLVAEAEAAEWALQAERDRTASHVAAAKAALNAIRKGAA